MLKRPGTVAPLIWSVSLLHSALFAGTIEKQVQPAKIEVLRENDWSLKLAIPAWIATTRGDTGINGNTSHSNRGFNEVANKLDMLGAIRTELWCKGRVGLLTDFSYFSLSDSVGVDRAIRKVDIQADQVLGEVALAWRVIDSPRGTLEILGGVRYTYLHEYVKLQGDDGAIRRASNRLAVAGPLVRRVIDGELREAARKERERFAGSGLSDEARRELADEISRIRGDTAERAEKIEKRLQRALNHRISRTDQWLDPFFGIRGKYQLSSQLYVLGRADVSPFDVGADFAWQASAGFGLQLSPRISYEVVYRILDTDYRHDGLIYDNTAHGPEATLAISF